jgi:hypothetical protein
MRNGEEVLRNFGWERRSNVFKLSEAMADFGNGRD